MDYVECQICKNKFRRITRTHLLSHNVTTSQYKLLYPDFPIMCESLLNETGKYFKENNPMKNPKYVQNYSKSIKGKKKSEEHKRKLSESQKGNKSHMWGKKRPEHSALMKKIMPAIMKNLYDTGQIQPTFKGKTHTIESKRKMSESQTGKNRWPHGNPNKGKKLNLTDEQRKNRSLKRCQWLKNNVTNKVNTNIELEFKAFCERNRIEFEPQFILNHPKNAWLCDFYIPSLNLIVEVDGEYWHFSKKQINRDYLKNKNALEMGYRYIQISSDNKIFDLIFQSDDIINAHNMLLRDMRLSKFR